MIWLNIALVVSAIGLVAAIMLQNRSAGLGGAFGGGDSGFLVRRGGEKRIYQITIILSALFLILAAAHLFIR
jgi:protein translocase SecG subunit